MQDLGMLAAAKLLNFVTEGQASKSGWLGAAVEIPGFRDAAAIPDPARPGHFSPPTCQHALRHGRTAGPATWPPLGAGHLKPFTYKTLGVFVDMAHRKPEAETAAIKWRGFPAWLLARTYHLAMMPGPSCKLRLLTDWTVGLPFDRDTSELGQLGHPPPLDGQSCRRHDQRRPACPVGVWVAAERK